VVFFDIGSTDIIECEIKEVDVGDPITVVDGCIGLDVRVVEHISDSLSIHFDSEDLKTG
jgi:hypothetical protein